MTPLSLPSTYDIEELGIVLRSSALADADYETLNRVSTTLDQLEELCDSVLDRTKYKRPVCNYPIPEDFKLSIVVPVYNERDTLFQLISRVRSLPVEKEILVVDDHSTDGGLEILAALERFDDVRVIFKHHNEGKGAALRKGFEEATGDVVIVQDADLEYNPSDILQVIRPIIEGEADVVYGSRFLEPGTADGSSHVHRWGNRLLTIASNLTTGLQLTDMETCYKAFRRHQIQQLTLQQNRFGFEPEVTAKIARRGWRIQEVPVRYNARKNAEGKKIGLRDLCNAIFCIVRYGMCG